MHRKECWPQRRVLYSSAALQVISGIVECCLPGHDTALVQVYSQQLLEEHEGYTRLVPLTSITEGGGLHKALSFPKDNKSHRLVSGTERVFFKSVAAYKLIAFL